MRSYLDFSNPSGFDPNQTVCTVCILDQSLSMEERDYPPTRLRAALMAVEAMLHEKVKHRLHDKMGVVGFSNKGIRICPLIKVSDNKKILRSLKNLSTIGSTNFVAGLRTAREVFEEEADFSRPKQGVLQLLFGQSKPEVTSRITKFVPHVVFLSDGYHNGGGDPVRVAEELKRLGAIIDTIGVGGTPSDVDQDCLKGIASVDSHRNPRYRFIGDTNALIQQFQRMATLQVL